jgi:hypothetical protein
MALHVGKGSETQSGVPLFYHIDCFAATVDVYLLANVHVIFVYLSTVLCNGFSRTNVVTTHADWSRIAD